MGDFHWRKGWDVLLDAWWSAFKADDPVVLVIKLFSGDDSREQQNQLLEMIANMKHQMGHDKHSTAPIVFVGDFLTEGQVKYLYEQADCYVSATRGEGWGLHLTEAMSMELPVVAPFWSGQTEFLNQTNAYPYNVTGLVPIQDPMMLQIEPGYQNHAMAEPDKQQLMNTMKHILEHKDEAREKGEFARLDMNQRFGAEAIAGLIDGLLEKWL
jgi:glycosyltransferase involved in cell wall biosynthesis